MNAKEYANAINDNVEAFWNLKITYETFHQRNLSLWEAIYAAGLRDEVSALLPVFNR